MAYEIARPANPEKFLSISKNWCCNTARRQDKVIKRVLERERERKRNEEISLFVKDFDVVLDHPITTKYIKVKATNFGKCPEWHLGYGGDTWLFFDEIVIE